MRRVRQLLSEPLIHFLIIGVAVFGVWSVLDRSPRDSDPRVIEVGPGRIAQLYETFSRTWQRPPTPLELNGLIEAFVKEEIFYREGARMGLDRDDTVIRRRMQQKMEFLFEPSEAELNPSDEELRAYIAENAATFHVPVRIAFRQVFFDPTRHGETLKTDIDRLLAAIEADESGEVPTGAGDPTLLPPAMPLMETDKIAANFGAEFAEALIAAPAGRWTGPLTSTFGQHLVFVDDRTEKRDPTLDEVRDLVLREWQSAKRRTIADERYGAMRADYRVIVTLPGDDTTSTDGADRD
ncbi:peptidylprolyl isomerase [Mesorhizobium sp. WSM2239]|uniref:Peptidylprolyl isomerase n=2 Tax=unclassified Mesorhizobium TaxID=325217 RepID=A0AAU8DFG8_9HYPH